MKKSFVVIGAVCIAAFVTFQGVSAYFTDRVFLNDNISVKGVGAIDDSGNTPGQEVLGDNADNTNPGGSGEELPRIWPVDISFYDDAFGPEKVLNLMPGVRIQTEPVVKNNGKGEVCLFFEVLDFEGQFLDFEISGDWEKVGTREDNKADIYVYGKAKTPLFLGPEENSSPVYNSLFLKEKGIPRDLYGQETEFQGKVYALDKNTFFDIKGDVDISTLPGKIEELIKGGSEYAKSEGLVQSVTLSDPKLSFEYGKTGPFNDFVEKSVSVKNDGNTRQWIYLKPEKSDNFTFAYGDLPYNPAWIKLPTEEEIYVYEKPLGPGESVEPLFDRIYSDTPWDEAAKDGEFALETMGLQAENLPIEVNTPEDFEKLLHLGKEDKVLFTKLKSLDLFDRKPMMTVVDEDFQPPVLLHGGDNIYKKEIWLRGGEDFGVSGFVIIAFSEERIREKTLVSTDGGETFLSFEEFFNNLPEGWSYKGFSDGFDQFVYEKPLRNGESSTKLITHFNTRFDNDEDARSFEIFVLGNFGYLEEEAEDEIQV